MSIELGMVVGTPNALRLLAQSGIDPQTLIARHQSGDWGDLGSEDWAANDLAMKTGQRLFSSYKLSDTETVWIITEWDRSATTVLLPEDY